jgi:site-specific recombinase XerD
MQLELKKLLKTTDFKYITFHGLRHPCASYLIYSGAEMKTVQEILGHAEMRTTPEIYAHISEDQKKKALSSLRQF